MIGRNMSGVQAAGDYNRPGPGGYIFRIVRAVNNPVQERVEIDVDFAEGEFAGYYLDLKNRAGFWGGSFSKSYKEKAQPFFRDFIETVQASNQNTDGLVIGDFEDVDETKLVNMYIGVVIGERQYTGNDGKTKRALDWYEPKFVTPDVIRSGNYTIPDLRIQEDRKSTGAPPTGNVVDTTAWSTQGEERIPEGFKVSDDDIPFR